MIFRLLLLLTVQFTNADKYFEIEDIPIEHFEHAEALKDAFDVELMPPRSSRSLFPNFGYHSFHTKIPEQQGDTKITDFEKLFENVPVSTLRRKRHAKLENNIFKELGKPLELAAMVPTNTTENAGRSNDGNTVSSTTQNLKKLNTFAINDFIRFKRSSEQDDLNENTYVENDKPNSKDR